MIFMYSNSIFSDGGFIFYYVKNNVHSYVADVSDWKIFNKVQSNHFEGLKLILVLQS
jgi:hypothetical protein